MDSFKESSVALANDRWMQRGVAVLAIDGPGQYESPLLGLCLDAELDRCRAGAGRLAAPASRDRWDRGLASPARASVVLGTILTANERALPPPPSSPLVWSPACHTIFEEASPTFKKRFMWMSNYTDEAKFNELVKTLTWKATSRGSAAPISWWRARRMSSARWSTPSG